MLPKLTPEYISVIAPIHGRSSCSDSDLMNGQYTVKEETVRGVSVKRSFGTVPRCNRCLLLEALRLQAAGHEPHSALTLTVDVTIGLLQPEFEIVQK